MNIPSVPSQRRSFHAGTDFNGRHRSVHDGPNASGMGGPSSHSPRRVAFSTVVSRISASPPPLESTGPNRGPARGAPGVAQRMGRRESLSVPFHRLGRRIALKFRLNGAAKSGISLRQALYRERLSQRNTYSLHDIAPNMSGMITLRVRHNNRPTKKYTVPLSSDRGGHVDLQTLARRTARAIVHYMQHNGIIVHWDRIVIHRLEEISPGIWIPVLMTH